MAIETVKDILDWTRALHERLRDTYNDTAREIGDERAIMLLNYIARHEQILAESIARFEKDGDVEVMDYWFQEYMEKVPFLNDISALSGIKSTDPNEILKLTIDAHQSLVNMYKDFSSLAKTERLKDLFDNLAFFENKELMQMVTSIQRMSDL